MLYSLLFYTFLVHENPVHALLYLKLQIAVSFQVQYLELHAHLG